MVGILIGSGSYRSERAGTAHSLPARSLVLHMLAPSSARRIVDILISSGSHRIRRAGTALSRYLLGA